MAKTKKKEAEEKKVVTKVTASKVVEKLPKPTASLPVGRQPVGYDPNLPMGKQREFIGLV